MRLSVRGALVLAYVTFELMLLVMTELASFDHAFTAGVMEVAWALVVVLLLLVDAEPILGILRKLISSDGRHALLRQPFERLKTEELVWIAIVTTILVILVAVGFLYLPTNADSMVYHLARVEHWIQNRTIGSYATHYTAQVEFSPLAEYNLAHVQLLSGTDRFDFLVQWLAASVSIVGVSELARLLGGDRWVQVMASVVCATIPTGILLATSTENDYVAAAMCLALLVLVASFRAERRWVFPALAIGAAAGLGYMTKGTTTVLMWPAAVGLLALSAYRTFRSKDLIAFLRQWLTRGLTMAAALLAVCLPFAIQTVQVFGSTVGPSSRANLVSTLQPNAMSANVVRETALNFDVGNGVSGIDTYLARSVLGPLGHLFNVFGISEADSRFADPGGSSPFVVSDYSETSRNENHAPSPWHTVVIVLSLVVLVAAVWRGRKWMRPALVLAVGLTVGYLLFNAVARWDVFAGRLNLPSFVAWSAVVAIALTVTRRWVQRAVLVGLVIACLAPLLNNVARPLVPTAPVAKSFLQGYFDNVPPLSTQAAEQNAASYELVTKEVADSGCERAALGNWVFYEYPIWVGLAHAGWHGTLDDINVQNDTAKFERRTSTCAVLRQVTAGAVTPLDGTVNVTAPIDILAPAMLSVSFDPNAAPHLVPPAQFVSRVSGTEVLPGGGWSSFGTVPVMHRQATLYLTSPSSRSVQLVVRTVGSTPSAILTLSVGGHALPVDQHNGTFLADIPLASSVTKVDLVVHPTATVTPPALAVGGVTVFARS